MRPAAAFCLLEERLAFHFLRCKEPGVPRGTLLLFRLLQGGSSSVKKGAGQGNTQCPNAELSPFQIPPSCGVLSLKPFVPHFQQKLPVRLAFELL